MTSMPLCGAAWSMRTRWRTCSTSHPAVAGHDVAYPSSRLARQLKLVARMIKVEFGARVYYVEHGDDGRNYDTHSGQLPHHASMIEELSGALGAFHADLDASGLANRAAVLVFSEFGRRVAENGSHGTDHGTAAPVFLLGGAVRGGLAGTTPSLTDLLDGDLKIHVDFRRVYAAVLERRLGLPAQAALGGAFERCRCSEIKRRVSSAASLAPPSRAGAAPRAEARA